MGAAPVGQAVALCALAFAAAFCALGDGRGRRTVAEGDPLRALVGPIAAAVGSLGPVRALLGRAGRERRRAAAMRELPTMLDVVTLGLSAGLSFDASLELYCQRYDTELSAAMGEALLSWRMGVARRDEALRSVASRLDSAALARFAGAVSQALAFGAPLASALEQQAQLIRDEQRSELEAEIERVPVRMLIPLGTLIVPAMLLAILGPLLAPSIAGMA